MRKRRGQVWSFDYTIGMLLFIITILLATSVLVKNFFADDSFEELHANAEAVSEQLMGTGYPSHWRPGDAISIGLITGERLSARKVERFFSIVQDDYERSKALLNTRYEYAVLFLEPDGTVRSFSTVCRIGHDDMTEQKTTSDARRSIAYYAPGVNDLELMVLALNGTVYSSLQTLFADIHDYDMVILENPQLSLTTPPYDGEKRDALESYVAAGGALFLIGNVSLPELFDMNLTVSNTTNKAAGSPYNHTLLNISGLTIQDLGVNAYTINYNGQLNFVNFSILPDERAVAASFTHGDGDVYFLGGLSGSMNETSEPLLDIIERGLNASTSYQEANCISIETDPNADQYVSVRRLVAYEGQVFIMRVDVWER